MEQAKRNTKKTKAILSLYEEMKKSVQDITRSQFTINIVDTLFKMPIFNTADFITNSNIPKPSAGRFLNLLVNNEILEVMEKGKGRIPNIYVFKNLYEIVK